MSTEVSMRPRGRAIAERDVLCIFGMGNLGRLLGLCLLQSGYRVVYGSRRQQPHSSRGRGAASSCPKYKQEAFNLFCFIL